MSAFEPLGSCLDLDLSISNGIISSKSYDERDYFNFDKVNYPHLDGDVPRATYYGVYISQQYVLQGNVLLLKIFTYASEQSRKKNSLNNDTGITNFA